MKSIIIVIFVCLCIMTGLGCSDTYSNCNRRYNPYVFNLPEFWMKAETVKLNQNHDVTEGTIELKLSNVSFRIPKEFAESVKPLYQSTPSWSVKSRHGVIATSLNDGGVWGCEETNFKNNNRDFCTETTSTQDYFLKLFTMTPEDCRPWESTGKCWVVQRKGSFFENVEKAVVYKVNDFSVFLRVTKEPDVMITAEIFHPSLKPDNFVSFTTNINDLRFVQNILSTLNMGDD